MEAIKEFWNSLGWLANAIEIVMAVGLLASLYITVCRAISSQRRLSKYKNISDYVEENIKKPHETMIKIKRESKIAIIDDNLSDFPVDYLRRAGFNVDVHTEVSLAQIQQFEGHDVILLDIVGVVAEDKHSGGLELIKRIKSFSTRPAVIAVSGKRFDPTVTDFFKLADDVLKKPISEKVCEERIVAVLEKRLSPLKAAQDVDAYASAAVLDAKEFVGVKKELVSYLDGHIGPANLRKRLARKYGLNDVGELINRLDVIRSWIGNGK